MTRSERLYRLLDHAGDDCAKNHDLTLWLALGGDEADPELLAEALALCGKHLGTSSLPVGDHQGTAAVQLVDWALDQLDAEGDQRAADEEAATADTMPPTAPPTVPVPTLAESLVGCAETVQRLEAGSVALLRMHEELTRALGYIGDVPWLREQLDALADGLALVARDTSTTLAHSRMSLEQLEAQALGSDDAERAVA